MTTLQESLERIETRMKAKPKARVTPKWRVDGYQYGLSPSDGCWNVTIMSGPAKWASLCIEGCPESMPSDEVIEAKVALKVRQFQEANA